MNNLPLVSIAMATYNGSKYLAMQLDSILNQTYRNTELVIVDDASSDDTVDIIKEYQKIFPNICLLQNLHNIGLVKTFEKAISVCHGEYIALSDQDDIWELDKLAILLNHIENNLLIHSDATLIDSNGTIIKNSHFDSFKTRNNLRFTDYLIRNNVTGCTCMFPRKLVDLAMPFPEYFYAHDHYLAIVASYYGTIKLLDERLVCYRQHEQNAIGAASPNFTRFLLECKKKWLSYDSLLQLTTFQNNWYIELLRDYRHSVYCHKWCSRFGLLKLFKINQGCKLLLSGIVLIILPRWISRGVYRLFYTCDRIYKSRLWRFV